MHFGKKRERQMHNLAKRATQTFLSQRAARGLPLFLKVDGNEGHRATSCTNKYLCDHQGNITL